MSSSDDQTIAPVDSGWPSWIVARLRRDTPLSALDLTVVLGAYLAPLVLRFNGSVPARYWRNFLEFAPVLAFCHLATNYLFGLYGQMWRYASVQEARRVVLAGLTAGGLVVVCLEIVPNNRRPLPISVAILGAAITLMALGAIRFQSRLFAIRRSSVLEERSRALVVGAGDAGEMVLKDILRNQFLGLDPVALVDDDARKVGRSIHGIPVLGTRSDIVGLVRRLRCDQVLFAIPSATGDVVEDVAAACQEAGVGLRILPSVREIMGGRVTARDIRDLRIEDLLGRRQVETDLNSVSAMLRGRTVLVTGAGGSIGSEIARQVAALGPARLVLLEHDETHLHDVLMDVDRAEGALADVRDQDRIATIFKEIRPDVVFHAAAHKHVPVLEAHPIEALRTNVIGTANVADAAVAANVGRLVLISTDKAIRPTSVMGASKALAEQVVRNLAGRGCVFCAVRFGNVLGSRGSVIPTFLRQIARGGPLTVTDPKMTRYFMSVQEAVQLVLQAGALSAGGEVFTLDMGEPVNILDLGRRLVRLTGRVPGKDIQIRIVGARPGEKIVEDLSDSDEEQIPSKHPSIVVSRPCVPNPAALRHALRELEALAREDRNEELAARMKELAVRALAPVGGTGQAVPSRRPEETVLKRTPTTVGSAGAEAESRVIR